MRRYMKRFVVVGSLVFGGLFVAFKALVEQIVPDKALRLGGN